MPKLIKEIQEDAHFPATAKVLLAVSLPKLAAKWLNTSGISAEYQDELSCLTAVLIIIQHDRKMSAKLDKMIAEHKAGDGKQPPKKETPAPEEKPAAAVPAIAAAPQQIAIVKQ